MPHLTSNYTIQEAFFLNKEAFTQKEYTRLAGRHAPYSKAVISITNPSSNNEPNNLRINNLLNQFKQLPDNWDGEDAIAPSKQALEHAFYYFNLLDNYKEEIYHAAPGPWGEIMLDVRDAKTQRGLELLFYEQKTVYVTIDKDGTLQQGTFSVQILPELLHWLHEKP